MTLRAAAFCAVLTFWPLAAAANDSIAELGTGGIVLSRTDAIAMQSENLFVSPDEIRVDYVFHNQSDGDVEAIVAFPMPDLLGSPYEIPALPEQAGDNFLGFEVTVDGKAVSPKLEQRASAAGLDVTDELKRAGVPLYPFGDAAYAALAALPEAVATDWTDRGMVVPDTYDDGSGWKTVRSPFWLLRSTYWWRARFPAGRDLAVSHRYKPSLGTSVGTYFDAGAESGEAREYRRRFCIDEAFERAVRKAEAAGPDGSPAFSEQRIRYVLKTGGNWALGTIGDFRLTVDKGDPRALVSFCADGVRKTGPTTYEVRAKDFSPERDLDILILVPAEAARAEPAAGASP